jgi:VIT1/CCC1 family predicted Fe2+/Mn2+ transporter
MAAVAYTSSLAEGARYEGERTRELRHIQRVPDIEREEIRAIYRNKGFRGELLDRVVETITADPEVWVSVMLAEEHGVAPISRGAAAKSALVVGVSSAVGSLLPVAPFALASLRVAQVASVAVAAAALFALGVYKARVTVGSGIKSGLEIAAIGLASAAAGYAVGLLFHVGTP